MGTIIATGNIRLDGALFASFEDCISCFIVDGTSLMDACLKEKPALVITSQRLPINEDQSWQNILPYLKQLLPNTRFIFIGNTLDSSNPKDVEFVQTLVAYGIHDIYTDKNITLKKIMKLVRQPKDRYDNDKWLNATSLVKSVKKEENEISDKVCVTSKQSEVVNPTIETNKQSKDVVEVREKTKEEPLKTTEVTKQISTKKKNINTNKKKNSKGKKKTGNKCKKKRKKTANGRGKSTNGRNKPVRVSNRPTNGQSKTVNKKAIATNKPVTTTIQSTKLTKSPTSITQEQKETIKSLKASADKIRFSQKLKNTLSNHAGKFVLKRKTLGLTLIAGGVTLLCIGYAPIQEMKASVKKTQSQWEETKKDVVIEDVVMGMTEVPEYGELIGMIKITPNSAPIGIKYGATYETLETGAGLDRKSTLITTDASNAVLLGHREEVFWDLKDVKIGDEIVIELNNTSLIYEIYETFTTTPEDRSYYEVGEDSEITLVTCYPFVYMGTTKERFIVKAKLVN